MKILTTLFLMLILLASSASCAITNKFGPYSGKVMDAGTKEPIEGAAVLVVFFTEEYGPAGAITRFADAIETVTDKNGEFIIPAHRVTAFRPLQGWDKFGYFTIFKPGYGCYPESKGVSPMFEPNGTLPEKQHVIIELPRLKTIAERRDAGLPTPSGSIPFEKQIKLIELINQERLFLGYPGKIEKKSWELLHK